MGDCASRPTESELDSHSSATNPKNDRFFLYLSPPETSQLAYFIHKKSELSQKLELPKQKHFLYLIEIQKLTKIVQPGLCFNHERPFVTVSLLPNGPYQETLVSDCYRPKWFRLIQFRTVVEFSKVLIEVKGEKGHRFGVIEKGFERNQRVREEWIEFADGMRLKVRIQFIYDEEALYRQLLDDVEKILVRGFKD